MDTWGIFSEEGCIESGYASKHDARFDLVEYYQDIDDDLWVDRMCPDHEEQSLSFCEECHA